MRGEFEEQDDVVLFIQRGKDTNGLPLYYRLRGTVRTENLHQKMKMAIGPWNVGPKSAHVLLVLICYRYNVMTKIRRCGQPDFGHFELHYIDRIQNRVREIFNILVWPRYDNQSVFRGKEDMVSVGIGPLTYNQKYVEHTSEPDATFSRDRLFMAKQMQLIIEWEDWPLSDQCKRYLRERESWQQIIILDGVTFIPASSFCNCYNIKKVIFSDTVVRIERSAFAFCSRLVYIKWSINTEIIGYASLYRCDLVSVFSAFIRIFSPGAINTCWTGIVALFVI